MDVVQLALGAEERLAVSDEVLEVPNPRSVNGRVIDLVEDAFGNSEPDPAQGRVDRAYHIFIAARPAGLDPGAAPGRMLLQQGRHDDSFADSGIIAARRGRMTAPNAAIAGPDH